MITSSQLPAKLLSVLTSFPLDNAFDNRALRDRARDLHREGRCVVERITDDRIAGRVAGRTGVYAVQLKSVRGGLAFSCTCPSDYYPCKHAGALLYTVRDLLSEGAALPLGDSDHAHAGRDTGNDNGNDNGNRDARTNRGGNSSFRTAAQSTAARAGARAALRGGAPHYQPGTVLGVSVIKPPARGRQNRFEAPDAPVARYLHPAPAQDPTAAGTGRGQAGAPASTSGARTSVAGKFRPAFLVERRYDYNQGGGACYHFSPVLVYMRRDGADGRIEPFSAAKARVKGDRITEGLLARCRTTQPNGLSMSRLLTRWRDEAENHAQQSKEAERAEFALPVEVYLSRSTHWERERRAQLRRITSIEVEWEPEVSYEGAMMLMPRVTVVDSEGYRETVDHGSGGVELHERGVLLPVFRSGSVWYLFDRDLPRLSLEAFGAIADTLTLRHELSYQEVMSLRALCGEHLGELVRVAPPPATLRIVTAVPVPVVDVAEDELGYATARLSYRYGEREVNPATSGTLLPVTAGELEKLEIATEEATEGTLWYVSRSVDAETEFSEAFGSAFDAMDGAFLAGDRYFSPRVSLWDFVASAGLKLLERGFELRVAGAPVARTNVSRRYRVVESGESWFDVEPTLVHAGEYLEIDEIIAERLVRSGGRLYVLKPGDEIPPDFTERQRIHVRDVAAIDEIVERIENQSHPGLREYHDLKRRLSSFDAIAPAAVPTGLAGALRPYQHDGLSWLRFLHDYGLGGILADDMGLGKTIQTLALLLSVREEGAMQRALVVCPVSTLSNWESECRRFAPGLRPLVHGGQGRTASVDVLRDYDVVLVSYDTFLRDAALFRELTLDYLILDEAQTIKNPSAKRRRALAELSATHRIALTGTPVENGVLELWSIMDVLMPGLLGARAVFSRRYGGGKRGGVDHDALARLQRMIRPLVLRRTKAQVAPELPPREEQIIYAELGSRQTSLYETLRSTFQQQIEAQLAAGARVTGDATGGERSRVEPADAANRRTPSMMILEAMLRLRQAAILPSLVDQEHCATPAAKMDLMVDMLSEIAAEDNKALVFSQFTAVLDEVERRLQSVPMPRFRLDGSTPQARRAEQIAAFQNAAGSACFLISLKAGGTGINLTAADYVLLLDPWWNPAVEAQAIDRSHRIGRNGTVFAYRFVARGTIEEKMLRLQERKREMANALIKADDGLLGSLSADDLRELFSR